MPQESGAFALLLDVSFWRRGAVCSEPGRTQRSCHDSQDCWICPSHEHPEEQGLLPPDFSDINKRAHSQSVPTLIKVALNNHFPDPFHAVQ